GPEAEERDVIRGSPADREVEIRAHRGGARWADVERQLHAGAAQLSDARRFIADRAERDRVEVRERAARRVASRVRLIPGERDPIARDPGLEAEGAGPGGAARRGRAPGRPLAQAGRAHDAEGRRRERREERRVRGTEREDDRPRVRRRDRCDERAEIEARETLSALEVE